MVGSTSMSFVKNYAVPVLVVKTSATGRAVSGAKQTELGGTSSDRLGLKVSDCRTNVVRRKHRCAVRCSGRRSWVAQLQD